MKLKPKNLLALSCISNSLFSLRSYDIIENQGVSNLQWLRIAYKKISVTRFDKCLWSSLSFFGKIIKPNL